MRPLSSGLLDSISVLGVGKFILIFPLKDRLRGLVVSSWLQIHRSGFDSRRYQIFWEVVDLERGPLSLVNIIEELF
jgi:hypothetical protein